MSEITCASFNSPALIVACSGAADVGELSDRVARELSHEKKGAMFCLAGVGARIDSFIKTAEGADSILAIDGCPVNCAAKTLQAASIRSFKHITITELGLEKGKSAPSEATMKVVYDKACELLKTTD